MEASLFTFGVHRERNRSDCTSSCRFRSSPTCPTIKPALISTTNSSQASTESQYTPQATSHERVGDCFILLSTSSTQLTGRVWSLQRGGGTITGFHCSYGAKLSGPLYAYSHYCLAECAAAINITRLCTKKIENYSTAIFRVAWQGIFEVSALSWWANTIDKAFMPTCMHACRQVPRLMRWDGSAVYITARHWKEDAASWCKNTVVNSWLVQEHQRLPQWGWYGRSGTQNMMTQWLWITDLIKINKINVV